MRIAFVMIPLLLFLFLHPINASDLFHHLNTGKHIVQTGTLPYEDTFSFTAYGMPWVAHSWGAALILYLSWFIAGDIGISVMIAAVGIGCSFLLYAILRAHAISEWQAVVYTVCAASIASLRWPSRPEVFASFFLLLTIWIFVRWGCSAWRLTIVFFSWGIVYGASAFLGIVMLVWWVVASWLSGVRVSLRSILIVLLCAGASCLNGYGLSSFLYIFQIPSIAPHTGEWLPLFRTMNPQMPELVLFYQYIVLSYVIFFFVCVLCVLFLFRKGHVWSHHGIFLFGLFVFLCVPFVSLRFINVSPFLVLPYVGYLACRAKIRSVSVYNGSIMLCISLAILTRYTLFSFGVGTDFPYTTKLVDVMKKHAITGSVFSVQEMGGFLSWSVPGIRVFSDTRDDLYQQTDVFSDLALLDAGRLPFSDLLDTYQADIVVGDLANGSIYRSILYHPDWKMVYLTDGFFLSMRSEKADRMGLPAIEAIDPLRVPAAKPGLLKEAIREAQSHPGIDQESLEHRMRRLTLYLADGDMQSAAREVAMIPREGFSGPRSSVDELATYETLSIYSLAVGDCKAARDHLTRADRSRKGNLLFFPSVDLPSLLDRQWGKYFVTCEDDKNNALIYYKKFLSTNNNPLQQREVEEEMKEYMLQ